MKSRWHVGWVLFAVGMVWAECWGDVPKLLFPHRTTPEHLFNATTNVIAVTGLALYAFGLRGSRAFWRLYAPGYAIVIAAQFGLCAPAFAIATAQIMSSAGMDFISQVGLLAITLPMLAMTVFSIIALFRLGDWIGPTRRPVGEQSLQLHLPL